MVPQQPNRCRRPGGSARTRTAWRVQHEWPLLVGIAGVRGAAVLGLEAFGVELFGKRDDTSAKAGDGHTS